MKYAIAFGVLFASFISFGQHLPDNKSFGLKANFNYYLPSFVSSDDETTINSNSNSGFGGGFYFRYDFNERFSFQPELMVSSRSGSVTSVAIRQPDPNILITETSVSNISQVYAELPLYFKVRWELIPHHRGHYKANKMIGIVFGPRLLFNTASSREETSSEVTQLYNQQSTVVRDASTTNASDFFAPVSFGWNIGVDFEVLNRLVLFGNYFRGLTSMNKPEFGFKSFDNRIEVGLGIRLY